MTTLILIRHGQSQANITKCFAGQSNPDLTENGKKQAEVLSDWLINNFNIDVIYASDLLRAYNTALPTAQKLKKQIIKTKELREINAGYWQGTPYEQIIKLYPEEYNTWLNDIGNSVCNGGESVKQLFQRVTEKIENIINENLDKTVLIVTHATPIRVILANYIKHDVSLAKEIEWVPNSSATICQCDGNERSFKLVGYDNFLKELKSQFPKGIV